MQGRGYDDLSGDILFGNGTVSRELLGDQQLRTALHSFFIQGGANLPLSVHNFRIGRTAALRLSDHDRHKLVLVASKLPWLKIEVEPRDERSPVWQLVLEYERIQVVVLVREV